MGPLPEIDRQTNKQTNRQTNGQANKQTNKQTNGQTHKQTSQIDVIDMSKERQKDKQRELRLVREKS